MTTKVLIGIGLGLAFGALVGQFLKSRGGACPLTCNPIGGALMGAIFGGLIASMLPASGVKEAFAALPNVSTADEFQQRVLAAETPVLVDYYSPSCPPCRMQAPILKDLAEEYAGSIEIVKVNVETSEELRAAYNVRAWPTLILFSGGQEVQRMVGLQDKGDLRAVFQRVLESNGPEKTSPPEPADPSGEQGEPTDKE